MLDGHLDCIFKVKLLLMISQSSAIHFCFFANNDLSRFQAFFSELFLYYDDSRQGILFCLDFFLCFDIGIHVRKIPRRFSIKDWLCCNPFCIANDLRINYVMDLSFGGAADLSLSTSILFPSIMPR